MHFYSVVNHIYSNLQDCNDDFAKALGYEGRDDLMADSKDIVKAVTSSKLSKLSLSSIVPEKSAPSIMR